MPAPKSTDEETVQPLNIHITDDTADEALTPEEKIRRKKGARTDGTEGELADGETEFSTDNIHITTEPVR